MSSPVNLPRTPVREEDTPPTNRTPVRTPTSIKTPSAKGTPSRSGRSTRQGSSRRAGTSVLDTPLRWSTSHTQGTIAASSDGPSSQIVPSSPNQAPQTSPLAAGMSEIDLSSPMNYGTPSSLGSIRTPRSGIRGTPIRQRTDISVGKHLRQVNLADPIPEEQNVPGTSESESAGPQLVIWGTNVVVNRCKEQFKRFVQRFIDPEAENDELPENMNLTDPLYMQKLDEIHTLEEPYININCAHLEAFDKQLFQQLVCYPQEVIPTLDMAANEMFFEKYPAAVLDHQIQVRPFNVAKAKSMRDLNPGDVDQLITIAGMVIRASTLMPEMRVAYFKCIVCHFTTTARSQKGKIAEPLLCTHCNNRYSFNLIHNHSHFSDKQMVKLQESQDDMPFGQTPHTTILFAHDDLVDNVSPGDRVSVTGIYRASTARGFGDDYNVQAVYKTHIDVVHFRKQDSKRLYDQEDGKDHMFPPERVELLKLLSQKRDIYDRLARHIAPSIYGNEDVKKGILLQLFGGTKKSSSLFGKHFRPDMHLLLCGDPGTSKSQLLQFVYNLVPRSQYSSGKGSTAVGLTAYVTRDPETRQLILQTGALVLADKGICCIDEFDKMNYRTRSVLHEVMEQQTLSLAKAGIVCQLNARTSILAAANPAESRWNKNKNVVENVMLPHTLMSRFDLIFLVLDPQDEVYDCKLARHMVSLYYKTELEEEDELVDMSILRDYIVFAKEHVHPTLNEESQQRLIQAYVDMRRVGHRRGQITAYPRQLESLIRLAEAHAKVRFSPIVEIEDVEEAWRLHREALKQSAMDPLSGKIDVTILIGGISSTARKKKRELYDALHTLIVSKDKQKGRLLKQQKVLADLRATSDTLITRELFEDTLRELQGDGVISILGKNSIRIS